MKNLAIIPARSGSKGLKDKNIKLLCGKPLIGYSIDAAKESGLFYEIMVSTDSKHYAEIAVSCGANVPFLRSDEMSTDTAGSWDVVREVLQKYREKGMKFDTVCLLQPTSPLRGGDDIVGGYKVFEDKKADAVTSVCEVDHSPLWTMKLDENKSLKEFRAKSKGNVPRQKLDTYYRLNGALYIRKVGYMEDEIRLLEADEYAYIMDRHRSVDIDTELDFEMAEFLMGKIGYRIDN